MQPYDGMAEHVKASKAAPKKTPAELLTDPHFIFTICSLVISVGIFFYYLFMLLCSRDENEGDLRKQIKTDVADDKRRKAEVAQLRRARQEMDQRIAEAQKALEEARRIKAEKERKKQVSAEDAAARDQEKKVDEARATVKASKAKKDDDAGLDIEDEQPQRASAAKKPAADATADGVRKRK